MLLERLERLFAARGRGSMTDAEFISFVAVEVVREQSRINGEVL